MSHKSPKNAINTFPWDAIHVESFAKALLTYDLPGYYSRQERAARKLQRYLQQVRKNAQQARRYLKQVQKDARQARRKAL